MKLWLAWLTDLFALTKLEKDIIIKGSVNKNKVESHALERLSNFKRRQAKIFKSKEHNATIVYMEVLSV